MVEYGGDYDNTNDDENLLAAAAAAAAAVGKCNVSYS